MQQIHDMHGPFSLALEAPIGPKPKQKRMWDTAAKLKLKICKTTILIMRGCSKVKYTMFMLFLLRPPTKPCYLEFLTSQCLHYFFCRGREVKQADESVLPVMKKEGKGEGKWTIGPRIKNGCENLSSF